MQVLIDLLDAITELAVINAMNVAARTISMPTPADGAEAAKHELMKLVTGVVSQDGTVVLTLNTEASMKVAPLYLLFAASWRANVVRQATLSLLKKAPTLQGVSFDLMMV